MTLLARLAIAFLLNVVALMLSAHYISGVSLEGDLRVTMSVALGLTALNLFLKPLLKLFLGPVILLTLGLGLIGVNMILLAILDFLFPQFSIQGFPSLLFGALLVGFVNFLYYFATKK